MKNRLQFNRHFPIFSGGTITTGSGEQKWIDGREQAKAWLENKIKRTDFIPLIGEPIVLRYLDKDGNKQLILAVGKATGNTIEDTTKREYHLIDTAQLQEGIDLANENAEEALNLASAATKDVANYLVILKNMIGPNGIFMEDGSYFDTDDPSNCGLYKNWSGNPVPYEVNYISGATNMFEADLMLDRAIGEQNEKVNELSGVTVETIQSLNDLRGNTNELSGVTAEFSASTVGELNEIKSDVEELSAATVGLSATTKQYLENIIEAAGLNMGEPGTYTGHDNTCVIGDATSLDNADVLLDGAICETKEQLAELSAATTNIEADLGELSAVTADFSASTVNELNELKSDVAELSGVTAEFSASTVSELNEIKSDVAELSAVTADFSANTVNELNEIKSDVSELSAATVNVENNLNELSAVTVEVKSDLNELSAATVGLSEKVDELSGSSSELRDDLAELSAATVSIENELDNLSAATIEVKSDVVELSAATVSMEGDLAELSGASHTLINNIIGGAGLEPNGTYEHVHEANFIDDAHSLMEADVILDATIAALSANTMAADQALNDKITEIGNRKIKGVSAITVSTENGDSTVSLVINDEYDKVLTQNALGLRANITLDYDNNAQKIYLKGKNDVVISEIDANDFIKDGMIKDVRLFTPTQEWIDQHPEYSYANLEAGKPYLWIEFNTEDAHVPVNVFIPLDGLVDVYTVSATSLDYLTIDNYQIRANVDTEHGLASKASVDFVSGITANIISGTGLDMGTPGGYHGHDETHYIKNAESLDNADVILDEAIWNVSGMVYGISGMVITLSAGTMQLSADTHNTIKQLSADTYYTIQQLSANTYNTINQLSAGTLQLSADTYYALQQLSAGTIQLSADTYYAIQQLSAGTIAELSAVTVYVNEKIDSAMTIMSGIVENYVENEFIIYSGVVEDYVESKLSGLSGTVIELIDSAVSIYSGVVENYVDERLSGFTGDIIEMIDSAITIYSGVVENYVENEFIVYSGVVENYVESKLSGLNFDEIYEYVDSAFTIYSGVVENYVDERLSGFTGDVIELINSAISIYSGVVENYVENYVEGAFEIYSGVVEDYVEWRLSGITGDIIERLENRICGLTQDLAALSGVVSDNEEVTAAALNELNRRLIQTETGIQNAFEEFSGAVIETIIDNEYTVASSLNDLNRRINRLSGSFETSIVELSGAVESKIFELSASVVTNKTNITNLGDNLTIVSGGLQTLSGVVIENEYVVAQAFNDLNDRMINVSGSVTELELTTITGVTVDGVVQPISGNVAYLSMSIPTVNDFFDGVEYDSNSKRINFYNGQTIKDYVDATDFIKDGMLDNVSVQELSGETYLSFIFNTDSGKETINIRVSDFAALYEAGSGITITNNQELEIKLANKGDTNFLKLDGDGLYLTGVNAAIQTAASGINDNLGALSASVITNKTNISNVSGAVVANETNISNVSGTAVANATNISNLSGSVVTNQGNITNMSGAVINNLANINYVSGVVAVNEERLEALSGAVVTNEENIGILSARVVTDEYVTAQALNDLNSRMLEVSATVIDNSLDIEEVTNNLAENYYTKTAVNNLISAYTPSSAQTALSAQTAGKLDHNVAFNLSGECYGSVTTDFAGNAVNIGTYKRFVTTADTTNLTLSEFLTVVSISSDETLTITNLDQFLPQLPAGAVKEAHIIIQNTGSTTVTVTIGIDGRVKTTGGNAFSIAAGEIGEVNVLITYNGNAYTFYVITS